MLEGLLADDAHCSAVDSSIRVKVEPEAEPCGEVPVVWVMPSILPDVSDERAMWLGAAIAVVTSLLLTTLAAALESSVNGPGSRSVAAPILWAVGGGSGPGRGRGRRLLDLPAGLAGRLRRGRRRPAAS